MPPTDQIDLSGSVKGLGSESGLNLKLGRTGQLSVTPEEYPEERAARVLSEKRAALIEDCKGVAVFAVLLMGIIALGCLSTYEGFFDASASIDTKRWSQTI